MIQQRHRLRVDMRSQDRALNYSALRCKNPISAESCSQIDMHNSYNIQTYYITNCRTHTHTIILLLFWKMSGTTRVSRYQKGKTRKVKPIWIYWSKRQWVAVASAGLYASLHPTNSVKALKAAYKLNNFKFNNFFSTSIQQLVTC